MIKTIKNDYLTVQVNLKGAEIWSVKDVSGTEYLWQGDPKYWSDRAFNIFPYVARMTEGCYTLHGVKYQMAIHGFTKDSAFEVVEAKADCITLQIKDTEETQKQYPFRFVFRITYSLEGNTLFIKYEVKNQDDHTMYFGLGGHPGFNVPLNPALDFTDYYIEFNEQGTPDRVIFSEDCFVMDGQTAPFKLENELRYRLHHDMFDEDAIIMTNMPKQVTLGSDKDDRKVRVTYPDMDYLGIWHMPKTDAPYICIEPWSSLPSRKDVIEELSAQDNLISLDAGKTYVNTWSVEII